MSEHIYVADLTQTPEGTTGTLHMVPKAYGQPLLLLAQADAYLKRDETRDIFVGEQLVQYRLFQKAADFALAAFQTADDFHNQGVTVYTEPQLLATTMRNLKRLEADRDLAYDLLEAAREAIEDERYIRAGVDESHDVLMFPNASIDPVTDTITYNQP